MFMGWNDAQHQGVGLSSKSPAAARDIGSSGGCFTQNTTISFDGTLGAHCVWYITRTSPFYREWRGLNDSVAGL